MGSFLGQEKVVKTILQSPTVLQLPGQNIVNVGGRQRVGSNLSLNIGTNGIGGLDTGSPGTRINYKIFAVPNGSGMGLVASASNAPTGFSQYRKIGEFFTNDSSNIIYSQADEFGYKDAVFQDSGSVAGGGAWSSDEYGAFGCSALMGRGLWKCFGYVASGNSGGAQEQIFQQLIFGDEDGDNTPAQPDRTILNTLRLSPIDNWVFGQFSRGAVAGGGGGTSTDDFNSMGTWGEVIINIPDSYQIFATARMQMFVPANAVQAVYLHAVRLGPYLE